VKPEYAYSHDERQRGRLTPWKGLMGPARGTLSMNDQAAYYRAPVYVTGFRVSSPLSWNESLAALTEGWYLGTVVSVHWDKCKAPELRWALWHSVN